MPNCNQLLINGRLITDIISEGTINFLYKKVRAFEIAKRLKKHGGEVRRWKNGVVRETSAGKSREGSNYAIKWPADGYFHGLNWRGRKSRTNSTGRRNCTSTMDRL